MGRNLPSCYGSESNNDNVNRSPQQQLSSPLQLMWNRRRGALQPRQESAGDDEVQMQQPSQWTSPIRGQHTGSSPSHKENSATEESIRQKAHNEIIRAEIEELQHRLLLRQREDLLHQLAMPLERPEPQFGNGQEPSLEGSQEGRYCCKQQTSERYANHWDRAWRHLIDIADAKVMELKAQVAYDHTI